MYVNWDSCWASWCTCTYHKKVWLNHWLSVSSRGAIGSDTDRYCLYYIRICTQPSDADTDANIDGCEKNDIRIRQNRISDINGSDVDTNHICDSIKDRLNGYTYITFYLIYNNIKCDTYYEYYCVHINTFTVSIVIRLL